DAAALVTPPGLVCEVRVESRDVLKVVSFAEDSQADCAGVPVHDNAIEDFRAFEFSVLDNGSRLQAQTAVSRIAAALGRRIEREHGEAARGLGQSHHVITV